MLLAMWAVYVQFLTSVVQTCTVRSGMSLRLEMRVSEELLARIDERRGDVPRATWIKGALEKALGSMGNVDPCTPGPDGATDGAVLAGKRPSPASSRAGLEAARAAVRGTAPSWSRLSEESEPFFEDLPPEERIA